MSEPDLWCFTRTGSKPVDAILVALARARRAWRHTDEWEATPEDGGPSHAQRIQAAADAVARGIGGIVGLAQGGGASLTAIERERDEARDDLRLALVEIETVNAARVAGAQAQIETIEKMRAMDVQLASAERLASGLTARVAALEAQNRTRRIP